MIITGGYNVYPREVEMVLEELSGIASVACSGLLTKRGPKDLRRHRAPSGRETFNRRTRVTCRNEISAYKVPKSWFFLETLPLNANGKLDRARYSQCLTSRVKQRARLPNFAFHCSTNFGMRCGRCRVILFQVHQISRMTERFLPPKGLPQRSMPLPKDLLTHVSLGYANSKPFTPSAST